MPGDHRPISSHRIRIDCRDNVGNQNPGSHVTVTWEPKVVPLPRRKLWLGLGGRTHCTGTQSICLN